ncbi:PLP-dependent aminotransferase family protein [Photobacterium sp. 1_MG-2023]|uniref:MocR-like pyridoxine biosynthesis transcription factor PdxR n=1 Tax=Photobacterium sp. 1_MG-2023 TaxID=3062646 RepID=UPI0026E1CD97|nr:PLP-dependent aminotransferase family protein [Photobacterium sp. 1_MG-2023]MDO6707600.1 PLP-dependent aminotransferase family protein [Photobacterium sp. 1_MG-2023]
MIETGDLSLTGGSGTHQERLFHAIRDKIVGSLWPMGGKLPSTRKLADELSLSRNTVTAAYEQLVAEGYIESRVGSGFYVSVDLPEHYLTAQPPRADRKPPAAAQALALNAPFAPGVPDLAAFPAAKWQSLLQRHAGRQSLMGNQDLQGLAVLRQALSDYLATSRSVHCNPDRIIITAGAQQALSLALLATLRRDDRILMEQPGYKQMRKIIDWQGYQLQALSIEPYQGLDVHSVLNSEAEALYLTPSNQYPMGTTLNTEQRLKLIDWAVQGKHWIIEDDYDSEFQFAHRPYTSLQGLAGQMGCDDQILYVGSFSKVMFNSLRLGYLVVPESLVERCLMIKDALTGDTQAHTQAALADFIQEGDLLRHIRKMRRLYKDKHRLMLDAISRFFGDQVDVISQPAGLHITLRWQGGISEDDWAQQAEAAGIVLRPMSDYEHPAHRTRDWQGAVLGFGNVASDAIDPLIARLATLFHRQL